MYIHRDGFGDVYNASHLEEATWATEVIERALARIATETNGVSLKFAIADLVFHKYQNISALLLQSMQDTTTERKLVFAETLWNMQQYENSFDIVIEIMKLHRPNFFYNVFQGLTDFKEHAAAKYFLVYCQQGSDNEWQIKRAALYANQYR